MERKEQAGNNLGYPDTAYNVVAKNELGYKGGATGTGSGESGIYSAEYTYDFADLPASFTSETDAGLTTIPVNSILDSVDVQVLETVSGGTDFRIGLSQPDGTVIDADGLLAANTSTVVGTYVAGAGADIGTSTITAAQVTLSSATTIRTAGVIRVVVRYKNIFTA
jgi:hypothetical protein